jgi:HD superfamily phosphohydrolase
MDSNLKRKIINDPVHGFITIQHPLIYKIISHPYYQRLRRINQMALAHLVYPGAIHSRLHHSLGAYHLMGLAITELRSKGTEISLEEEIAAKAAILLHDIGHGPFSHALENKLIPNVHHEDAGLKIMHLLNEELNGELSLAIKIFTNQYSKQFLYQLISGQLDVDRLDYLTRDSFFTGVSEGVVGYDRIIKMLVVHNDQLMIEEKGIYSVEKFLVARRQMYWQVYLHKTVLAAEKMLVKIIERVREIYHPGDSQMLTRTALDYFLGSFAGVLDKKALEQFCLLDDSDILASIKIWSHHKDSILSTLCKKLLNRELYRCQLQSHSFSKEMIQQRQEKIAQELNIPLKDASYYIFSGDAINTTYKIEDEHILILFKNGTIKPISEVENPLIHETLSTPIKKFYLCQLTELY